jgi:nucleoside phosphorylase
LLADLRIRLWDKFRLKFESWKVRPLYAAAAFGSAARGDGDVSSDIDVFLVHPPLRGERKPSRSNATLESQIADALGVFAAADDAGASRQWEEQLDSLRESAERWTGNPLQIVDLSFMRGGARRRLITRCLKRYVRTGSSCTGSARWRCGRQVRRQIARREAVAVTVV